jgi:hypothetical protein
MTDTTKPGDPADKAADGAFGGVTSHRAGYGDKLARVEDWVRRHPSATLASGEGAVLLAEIDRQSAEIGKLRAAILRVWRQHQPTTVTFTGEITGETWNECDHCRDDNGFRLYYPCPTLRALDGEAA